MPRILTIGTFDRLHDGHRDLLRYARTLAGPEGSVIVALNRTEFVEHTKGFTPDTYGARRIELRHPRGVRCVPPDSVVQSTQRQKGDSVLGMLTAQRPDLLLVGSDWAKPKKYLRQIGVTWADLERLRITLAFAPRPADGPSSTKLREAEKQRPNLTIRTPDADAIRSAVRQIDDAMRRVRISGANGLTSGTYEIRRVGE